MKTEVSKFNPTNPDIPKLSEYNDLVATVESIREDDLFFDSRAEQIVVISKIEEREDSLYVTLHTLNLETREREHQWTCLQIDQFIKEYSERYIPDFDSYSKSAEDYLFKNKPFDIEVYEEQSTGLVHRTNKQMLQTIHGQVELKKKKLSILQSMVSVKMVEQQNKLQIIKRKMESQIAIFQKEMNKIMKAIGMIELYLGIEEELYQLQEGNPSSIETPISLRQMVLYADEELGNCDSGGIDYSQLNLFDEWLVKDQNYKILLPEERGIVAIKPRRYDKDYGDRFENAIRNRWNQQTYFLIRNGENLFRICSPNISVGDTMFPKRKEFQDLLNGIENEEYKYSRRSLEEKQNKLKDKYMMFSLFVQGLIDRTEVFSPMKEGIKISEIEENGGIQPIYDAEMLLPSGRLSFRDWQKEINSNVGRGSRIVLRPDRSLKWYRGNYGRGEGFLKYYSDEYSMPDKPNSGLYTLEDVFTEDGERLIGIKYMPSSETYSWTFGSSERKNRVSWIVSLDRSWYLNYDRICLDDIDFYLNSRIDRPNYLNILPLLRELKKRLIEEQKKEEQFKLMLKGIAYSKKIEVNKQFEQKIDEAIDWFKFKNIWKRPITQDDSKATRMIQRRLFSYL